MNELKSELEAAVQKGDLLGSSAENIRQLLAQSSLPIVRESIRELVAAGQWDELNDRFFRTLAFGTGGLRGRSIGKVVTKAEEGVPADLGRPQHPCTGTNAMNYFNISRATQGLVVYLKEWMAREMRPGKPKIVLAHDTRHFSREFAALAAKVASGLGCDAVVFDGPRSTPELSFAIRYLRGHAGAVVTASHNPPHDNGFKVYFADGAQVVEPHASGIIGKVNATASDTYTPVAVAEQGVVETAGTEVDDAYMARLETVVLDRAMVKQSPLRIVFTPIHGTGGVIIKPMLERLGFHCAVVPEQDRMDGRFPTVKSPNPENAEALALAVRLAEETGADLVIGTDPDCDRMGVAVRSREGRMVLFTGNQIGSLMAYYRVKRLFESGILNEGNAAHGVIIKTFVTSDLQKAIAEKAGLRCVETLTGFKYIGQKLTKYEEALPEAIRGNYASMTEEETRKARLEHSSYYVFGGEESYGYSGADFVRDKDGNGSAVMFAEVAAYAKSRGLTLDALLDEVYAEYGYYLEKNGSMTFEGAEGADKIRRLIDSYSARPPAALDGSNVVSVRNFATEEIRDVEGDRIPAEKMLMFEVEDGRRVAVRPSGTEPKIKFYMFARRLPAAGTMSAEELAKTKRAVDASIDALWAWVQSDVESRAEG